MWWKVLIFVLMSAMIVASFVTTAPWADNPERIWRGASRILYYHVPQAWMCVLAYAISMIFSIRFLRNRNIVEDDRAVAAASLGFMFCFLATITGAVFARATWGSFWNWDPRETSIFILLLIYAAYFALRNAIDEEEKRAALSAVYSIFAFLTVPFLVFVLPRMLPGLHPGAKVPGEEMTISLGPVERVVFFSSIALFTTLFFWIYNLAIRIRRLERTEFEEDL